MEGEMDNFEFVLAERLGMTLGQIRALPNSEYVAWKAFHLYRNAQRELAAQK